ncbi:MAG TPA: hypothetical protein VFD25_05395 [Clostridia bacterium]|nr:hypothetical protein [Clostridia bacterium]
MKRTGVVAGRTSTGEFLPAKPIHEAKTETDEKVLDQLAELFLEKFKESNEIK